MPALTGFEKSVFIRVHPWLNPLTFPGRFFDGNRRDACPKAGLRIERVQRQPVLEIWKGRNW